MIHVRYIYGRILKYTGCTGFGVLWWCCALRCVVLCTCVVAPLTGLTGLSCAVRVSSYFLSSRLIVLSFHVRLDSAAAHVVRGASFSGTSSRLGRRSGGYNQLAIAAMISRVHRKFPVVDSMMAPLRHEQISSRKSRLTGTKFTFSVLICA